MLTISAIVHIVVDVDLAKLYVVVLLEIEVYEEQILCGSEDDGRVCEMRKILEHL